MLYKSDQLTNASIAELNKPETIASLVTSKLSMGIEEQGNFIYAIQEKLHTILNQRKSEKEPDGEKGQPLEDFSSHLQNAVDTLFQNNSRLQDILSHLNKII